MKKPKPREISLSGSLIPVVGKEPLLVTLFAHEPPATFLPVFTSVSKLRAATPKLKLSYDAVKVIDDPKAFLDAVPKKVVIAIDPRPHSNAKKRKAGLYKWSEVIR